MQKIIASYEVDSLFSTILAAKAMDSMAYPGYSLTHDILRYKGLVCVGQSTDIRKQILEVMHMGVTLGYWDPI